MRKKEYKSPRITINKVYTKTGDSGLTSIVGGHKLSKSNLRINTFGEIEELNAHISLCIIEISTNVDDCSSEVNYLQRVQHELFNLGNMIATLPEDFNSQMPAIDEFDLIYMEDKIDLLNKDLPTLNSFILPGGSDLSVKFHIARSICRRCERLAVQLSEIEKIDNFIIKYLNRLSDLLFVLSRWSNNMQNIDECIWNPNYKD